MVAGRLTWTPRDLQDEHILIYGLCGGVLIVLLKLVEYRFLVVEHSIEIYGGLIALLFAALGIWLGHKLTKNKETISGHVTKVTWHLLSVIRHSSEC